MARYPEQGGQFQPPQDWQSEMSNHDRQYPEKQPYAEPRGTSKRSVFRLVRLGLSLALTIAALVLTLMILVIGRHGDGSSDLSLITVSTPSPHLFTYPLADTALGRPEQLRPLHPPDH